MDMKKAASILLCLLCFSCASQKKTVLVNSVEVEKLAKNFTDTLIKSGVDIVQKENATYHNREVIKSILPENKKQMENLALITSKRIENAADEIKSYLALKQMKKAHNAFSDMVNACTDCHTLVRGW